MTAKTAALSFLGLSVAIAGCASFEERRGVPFRLWIATRTTTNAPLSMRT